MMPWIPRLRLRRTLREHGLFEQKKCLWDKRWPRGMTKEATNYSWSLLLVSKDRHRFIFLYVVSPSVCDNGSCRWNNCRVLLAVFFPSLNSALPFPLLFCPEFLRFFSPIISTSLLSNRTAVGAATFCCFFLLSTSWWHKMQVTRLDRSCFSSSSTESTELPVIATCKRLQSNSRPLSLSLWYTMYLGRDSL